MSARIRRPLSEVGKSRLKISIRLLALVSDSDPGVLDDPQFQRAQVHALRLLHQGNAAAGDRRAEAVMLELDQVERDLSEVEVGK